MLKCGEKLRKDERGYDMYFLPLKSLETSDLIMINKIKHKQQHKVIKSECRISVTDVQQNEDSKLRNIWQRSEVGSLHGQVGLNLDLDSWARFGWGGKEARHETRCGVKLNYSIQCF